MIEIVYLVSGLVLPIFYFPQVYKLYNDNTGLASYSLGKCAAQLLLRLPALAFALFVVKSDYMNAVLAADVLGRVAEFSTAIYSLRRQGVPLKSLYERANPLETMALE
ncbi:hypothetical protein LP417_33985 (plasmid) [Polaromonas sp. P1-6]|nr:hypothetical protein LP417_33985 [Polaromonas sp. P1-6]